jgi:hypothetical protein
MSGRRMLGEIPPPSESSSRSARFMIMAMGQRWGKPERPRAAYRRRFADRQVEDIVHGEGPDGHDKLGSKAVLGRKSKCRSLAVKH